MKKRKNPLVNVRSLEYVRKQVANDRVAFYNCEDYDGFRDLLFFESIPSNLLADRLSRLTTHKEVRERFLITTEPPGEWTESLIGDYAILVVHVDDLEEARHTLYGA